MDRDKKLHDPSHSGVQIEKTHLLFQQSSAGMEQQIT